MVIDISGIVNSVITGLILAVIGSGATIVLKKIKDARDIENHPTVKLNNSTKSRFWTLPIVVAVIRLLLGGIGTYTLTSPTPLSSCPIFAKADVRITSPLDGDEVNQQVKVTGTSCHISTGYHLRMVLYSVQAGLYYPQRNLAAVSSDGFWKASITVGASEKISSGNNFWLIPVLADAAVSVQLNNIIDSKGKNPASSASLPENTVQMNYIVITRR